MKLFVICLMLLSISLMLFEEKGKTTAGRRQPSKKSIHPLDRLNIFFHIYPRKFYFLFLKHPLSYPELLGRANFIVSQMTDNPLFPSPEPSLAAVLTMIANYEAILTESLGGEKQRIAEKNSKRRQLTGMLHLLGSYVVFAAKGDAIAASSSGFTVAKGSGSAPAVVAPENIVLDSGLNPGELAVRFPRVKAARCYTYEYTPDPLTKDSIWKLEIGTQTKNVFKGLESGKRYWVRVAAVGSNKQLVHCRPQPRIVL